MKKDFYAIIQNSGNYKPIELNEYDDLSTFQCTRCGNIFASSVHYMIRNDCTGVCPFCETTSKTVSYAQAVFKFNRAADGEYDIVSYAGKMRDKSVLRHNKCGCEYSVSLTSFIDAGRRCPQCFGSHKYSLDDVRKLISAQNSEYEFADDHYAGIDKKIHIRHKACGYEYPVTLHNFLHGSRCPQCWRQLNRSKGESQIRQILTAHDIAFEEQKTFDGLVNKRSLKYDFYVPSKNLCIEYDGKQHFEYDATFQHTSYAKFAEQREHDKIKTEYCRDHSINLLRIKYKLTNKKIFGFMDDFLSSTPNAQYDKGVIFYNDFDYTEYFE